MLIAIIIFLGVLSGILAGIFGIGGGIVLVPALMAWGMTPLQATAASSVAILFSAVSGTASNWRKGSIDFKRVFAIGIPALLGAPVGVWTAHHVPSHVLTASFTLFLVFNLYLMQWKKKAAPRQGEVSTKHQLIASLLTGIGCGFLAGLFGVGGGIILVPILIVVFRMPIRDAIRTSLAVICITALSAIVSYFFHGTLPHQEGILVGLGGIIGTQIGLRILARLSEQKTFRAFQVFILALTFYMAWRTCSFLLH